MRLPAEVLMALCVLVGLFPMTLAAPMVNVAAGSILGAATPDYHIAIWHGFNMALAMSVIALGGGAIFYLQRLRLFDSHRWCMRYCDGKATFEALISGVVYGGRKLTGLMENGSLQRYNALLVGAVVVLGASPFFGSNAPFIGPLAMASVDPVTLIMGLVLMICAVATAINHRNRILAIIMLGTVGLIVSLAFIRFSAPDLALTQISVEVVTIILLMMALHLLPRTTPVESTSARRLRDIVLSVAAGGGCTALMMAVLTRPYDTIAGYFLENSKPGGGGTNVVNVILVDFRGFDTFGEIIVLGIAALTIFALVEALLDGRASRRLANWLPAAPKAADRHPLMMVVATRVMMPISLLVGAYIFLRGHNEPGGGFIAGLIVAIALLMQYMASGFAWAEARQRVTYHATIGLGVLIASVTGIGAWLNGRPFLTSDYGYLHFPPIEEFEWATAMAFDIGVFLTVVGAVMLALNSLSKMARRTGETVNVFPMDVNPAREDTPSEGKT